MGSRRAHRRHTPLPFRDKKDLSKIGKENELRVYDLCYDERGRLIKELRDLRVVDVQLACGIWDHNLVDMVFAVQNCTRVYPVALQIKSSLSGIGKFEQRRADIEGGNYKSIASLVVTQLDTPAEIARKLLQQVQNLYGNMIANPDSIPAAEKIERELLHEIVAEIQQWNVFFIKDVSIDLGEYGFNHPMLRITRSDTRNGVHQMSRVYIAHDQFEKNKMRQVVDSDLIVVPVATIHSNRTVTYKSISSIVREIIKEVQNGYQSL